MSRKILWATVLMLMALTSAAYARVYYMAPNGSNSNDGRSIASPWATLQYADGQLAAGDTLYVLGGMYTDVQYLETASSGRQGSPIVVKAYPGSSPMFSGGGNPSASTRFSIKHDWWVIDGLSAIGGGTGASQPVVMSIGSDYVTVSNCNFRGRYTTFNTGTYKIVDISNASWGVIRNCTLQYAGLGDQTDGMVLTILNNSHHWIIENNIIGFGNHDAILIKDVSGAPPHHIILRNNVIDNEGTDVWGTGWQGGHGISINYSSVGLDSIPMYNVIEGNKIRVGSSTYEAKDAINWAGGVAMTIRGNILFGNYWGGFGFAASTRHSGRVLLRNFVYNNTVYKTGKRAICLRSDWPDPEVALVHNTIANNIFYDARESRGTDYPQVDYLVSIELRYAGTWWDEPDEMGGNRFYNNLLGETGKGGDTLLVVNRPSGNPYRTYHDSTSIKRDWAKVFFRTKFGDPLFASKSLLAMPLSAQSPCIDAGMSMAARDTVVLRLKATWPEAGVDTLRWVGRAPDIGAFEYGMEYPVPPSMPRWQTRMPIIDKQ